MADEKVKVAVRVRPFSKRELDRKMLRVVDMVDKTTILINPNSKNAESHKFTFDYSYWSHDGYKETENGILEPDSPKYVDQNKVFNDLGLGMLHNAWQGYNCSVFAYGQTGSGKSYSIMGFGANKGIVPRMCQALFEDIDKNKKEGVEYQVTFSMLEIYNEKVRDLLNKQGSADGLRIRNTPANGFTAEGLKTKPVGSFADIMVNLNEGDKNRTLASTKMNEHSSRAHTIVTITFAQKYLRENMTKFSSINLVDLAGSERAVQTGATGDRFEESKNINKSLLTLGSVIKGLCDHAAGKKAQIPYRDSKLTMLLKNALGGNSKTIMVAAISPAAENYDQTLSTLRYADRAKAIVTKAKVNESETDKLIKELIAEKERLLKELNDAKSSVVAGYTEKDIQRLKEDQEQEITRYRAEIEDVQKSWQKRLEEARQDMEKMKIEDQQEQEQMKKIPHFWNLNEDPGLTRKIVHLLQAGVSRIGSRKTDPSPEILLNGPSIHKDHAAVDFRSGNVYLLPHKGKILLNGVELKEEKKLRHQDRIMFGSTSLFVFHHPEQEQKLKEQGKKLSSITYDYAQNEIAKHILPEMEEEDFLIKEEVLSIMPLVQDANGIAEEMNKNVQFDLVLVPGIIRGVDNGRTMVYIKMKNLENENQFFWDKAKFLNRQCYMTEMYQTFEDLGRSTPIEMEKEKDPFWEPPSTDSLVGLARVPLESLAYMFGYHETITVINYEASQIGFLKVELCPCDVNGEESEDFDIEHPVDLVGQNVMLKVKIDQATNLPKSFNEVWCEYKLYNRDHEHVKTHKVKGINPKFQHEALFKFTQKDVTHEFVDYLQESSLMIEVWGHQEDKRPDSATMSRTRTSLGADNRKLIMELNQWRLKAEKYEDALKQIEEIVNQSDKGTEIPKISKIIYKALQD